MRDAFVRVLARALFDHRSQRAFPRFLQRPFHARLVAGPPAGKLGGADLRLVGRHDAVGERDHPEYQEELPEAILRAHDRVAEEEERDPLQLLAEASQRLQHAHGLRVERLDEHEQGKGEHPPRQRRQPELLFLGGHAQDRPQSDREYQDVARRRDAFASARAAQTQPDGPIQEAQVEG